MAVKDDEKSASVACLKLNSEGTLANETPISISLFKLNRLQLWPYLKYKRCL